MSSDFASVYSSKTDDELLALAAERKSLTPEAESSLWAELRRRKLTDPHLLYPSTSGELPRPGWNPAFNLPAKLAAITAFVAVFAVLLIGSLVAAREHVLFAAILVVVGVWTPIFAALAWATRRALRNRSPRNERH